MEKECFKKFDSTADCFSYHSNIFKKVKRYQKLFDNSIYDYRSWAIGIKKYGYATDPDYSKKVIGIIEKYKLDKKDIIPIFLFI
jgi:flagellum-specific peptidoglycan hydrolase FlgJ